MFYIFWRLLRLFLRRVWVLRLHPHRKVQSLKSIIKIIATSFTCLLFRMYWCNFRRNLSMCTVYNARTQEKIVFFSQNLCYSVTPIPNLIYCVHAKTKQFVCDPRSTVMCEYRLPVELMSLASVKWSRSIVFVWENTQVRRIAVLWYGLLW